MLRKTDSDSILEQAIGLMRRQGYRSMSIADLGKSVGLLKGSVYHHFASKQEILERAIDRTSNAFWECCLSIAYNENLSNAERWHAMLDWIESYYLEHRACLMAHLSAEGLEEHPEARHRIQQFFTLWGDAFAHVLEPTFGPEQSVVHARDAIALLEGSVAMMPLWDDVQAFRRSCDSLRTLI